MNRKFFVLLDFDRKILQRASLWIDGEHNPSDFKLTLFQRVSFRLELFLLRHFETKKAQRVRFWVKSYSDVSVFKRKRIQPVGFECEKNNASDFDPKFLQRVRFCIAKKSTQHILNKKFYDISDFKKTWTQKITFRSFSRWNWHILLFFVPS